MYLDETDVSNGVSREDAIALMESHAGVTVTRSSNDDGQEALRDLQLALAQEKAVIVSVNSAMIWTAVPDQGADPFPNHVDHDHAISVIAVDTETLTVQLNDSSGYQGMTAGLGAFMDVWRISRS